MSNESKPSVQCKYGQNCYRKNTEHFKQFSHPFDHKTRLETNQNNSNDIKTKSHSTDSHIDRKRAKTSSDVNFDTHKSIASEIPFSQMIDSYKLGFYLTKVEGIDNKFNSMNSKSISIKEILSDKMGSLLESVQFNYMFDIEWLVAQYDRQFRSKPLLIVYGNKRDGNGTKEMQNQTKNYPSIRLCAAQLQDVFGTHHSKLMFLRYDKGLRVVIHTANLIPQDWCQKTQGVWVSPLFPPIPNNQTTDDVSKTRFKTDLIEYLNAYNSKELNYWSQLIKGHDMSSAKVFLISSVPGRHLGPNCKSNFGHLKLRKVLNSFGPSGKCVDKNWPVIGQFSSIGSLGPTPDSWLTSEFLNSLSTVSGMDSALSKPQLKLVFPSVEDVRNSLEGYIAGSSLPYSIKTASKQSYLNSFLHLWRSELRGRTNASPHIKSYTRVSSDFKRLCYVLITSANLSKAAWGQLEKNGSQLAIKSYEIGVLFLPQLFGDEQEFDIWKMCETDTNTGRIAFPIPYDLPLTPYSSSDKPWTWDSSYTDKPDRHGQCWTRD